jgi:uncharacterized protein (TIGR03000 family)
MSLAFFRTMGIAAVALLGISLLPGRSAAEQGWPITENRAGSSYSPRYYRTYVPAYTNFAPARVPSPALASTSIRVQVPAQARVWFDNQSTSQTGAVRDFVSPPLTPGQEYRYTVRATWSEDGHEIQRQQVVSFSAGDPVSIDFTMSMVSVGR